MPYYTRQTISVGEKFLYLCKRSLRHIYREPSLLLAQTFVTLFVAISIGGIFYSLDRSLDGIQNRVGSLFFMTLYFSLISMSSMGTLFTERIVFLRERDSKVYTTFPYFLSQLICDLIPLRVIPPILFGCTCYWLMGLNGIYTRFVWFIIILVLINVVSTSACFAISSSVNSVGTANLIASLFFIFSMLFGGLFLNNNTAGDRFVWFHYLSFIHYGYEALMCTEFDGMQDLIFNPENMDASIISGIDVLNQFAMDATMFWYDIGVLVGFFVVFIVIAFVFLKFRRYSAKT